MSERVRVESVEALLRFRAALCKCVEKIRTGLDEAESEIQFITHWVKEAQRAHWKKEGDKRSELVVRAKSALARKKLQKTALGSKFSYVEEEKALLVAQRRLEEAKEKFANVKHWSRTLDEEYFTYKSVSQGLDQVVNVDIPVALAQLDNMIEALQAYATSGAPDRQRSTAAMTGERLAREEAESMARQLPTMPPADADYCRALRARTPGPAVRDATPIGELILEEATAAERVEVVGRILGAADLPALPLKMEEKIVVAAGVWEHELIYLERSRTETPGDSGWYAGFADDVQATGYEGASIGALLARRAELAGLLELPPGYLAVLRGGIPLTIFDEVDKAVWSTSAPGQAYDSEGAAEDTGKADVGDPA